MVFTLAELQSFFKKCEINFANFPFLNNQLPNVSFLLQPQHIYELDLFSFQYISIVLLPNLFERMKIYNVTV